MELKICSKCKQLKLFSEFVKNKDRKNGISSICKNCKKVINAINYRKLLENNPEKIKAYKRTHYNNLHQNLENTKLSETDFKKCTKCKIVKNTYEFYKSSYHKTGYYHWCKDCHSNNHLSEKVRESNRVRSREYYAKNKDRLKRERKSLNGCTEKELTRAAYSRIFLADSYVKNVLKQRGGPKDISKELLELKRSHLKLRRVLNEIEQHG